MSWTEIVSPIQTTKVRKRIDLKATLFMNRLLMSMVYVKHCGSVSFGYLVWFEAFLTNIDSSQPGAKELLEKGGIAVARSLIPGALSAVDTARRKSL